MAQSYGGRGREERPRARRARAPRPRIRVEEGGGTRTLVVDETFASFYRPGEIATHCVWDAIAAPILWLPPKRRRRILVLGLGGGSVARIARALAPRAEIVGIEFEPEVVRLARRHLDLDETGVEVAIADARAWIEAESKKTSRYDAILEDVFVGAGDDVHKPDWIPDPMHAQAFSMLAPGGVFVSNTLAGGAVDARALRGARRDRDRGLRQPGAGGRRAWAHGRGTPRASRRLRGPGAESRRPLLPDARLGRTSARRLPPTGFGRARPRARKGVSN